MGVDSTKTQADSGLVLIGSAIKSALGDRPQRWLATATGIDPAQVTRIIKGQMKDLSVERVREIEDALELHRGALLRAGGYVADVVTPEEAIRNDTTLTPDQRETLLRIIESAFRTEP